MVELCDRCSAKALTRFTKSDMELAFCGHHRNGFYESLSAQGFVEVVTFVEKVLAKAL